MLYTYMYCGLTFTCTCVALIFGKSSTPRTMENLRTRSVTLNWSDSDSSIDSMPSSSPENSDNEGDWPERTGFHVRTCRLHGNQWNLRMAHNSDVQCSYIEIVGYFQGIHDDQF